MEILAVAVIVFAVYLFMRKAPVAPAALSDKLTIVVREKQCPPHAWGWQEMVDKNGAPQGERIICKHCGPLSKNINNSDHE